MLKNPGKDKAMMAGKTMPFEQAADVLWKISPAFRARTRRMVREIVRTELDPKTIREIVGEVLKERAAKL